MSKSCSVNIEVTNPICVPSLKTCLAPSSYKTSQRSLHIVCLTSDMGSSLTRPCPDPIRPTCGYGESAADDPVKPLLWDAADFGTAGRRCVRFGVRRSGVRSMGGFPGVPGVAKLSRIIAFSSQFFQR